MTSPYAHGPHASARVGGMTQPPGATTASVPTSSTPAKIASNPTQQQNSNTSSKLLSDDSKKLHAAEAYNRFMEKRVRYLEHQLEVANNLLAAGGASPNAVEEAARRNSPRSAGRHTSPKREPKDPLKGYGSDTSPLAAISSGAGGEAQLEEHLGTAKHATTLVTENIKLNAGVKDMKQQLLNKQREISLLKANVDSLADKLKSEKDRGASLESELADVKMLLPSNLFGGGGIADGTESMFGGIAPSQRPAGGVTTTATGSMIPTGTFGRSRNDKAALEATIKQVEKELAAEGATLDGKKITSPTTGMGGGSQFLTVPGGGAGKNQGIDDSASARSELLGDEDEAEAGSQANLEETLGFDEMTLDATTAIYDAANSMVNIFGNNAAAPGDPQAVYESRVGVLRHALSFAKDDMALDDPTLPANQAAAQPKTQVERALALFKKADEVLATSATSLQGVGPIISEAYANRRAMLNFLVETQAQRGKIPAGSKVRGTNIQGSINTTRDTLNQTFTAVTGDIPQTVQAVLSCVSATMGLYIFHKRNPDVALCLSVLEETLGTWLGIPNKLKPALELPRGILEERFESTMQRAQTEGVWERLDLPQLKEMSLSLAERGSQGAEAHATLKDVVDHCKRTKKLLETLWRLVRGESVDLRFISSEGGPNLEEESPDSKVPKFQHKTTQCNFNVRQVTELDMQLKQLASIRQPWFEVVKEVTPRVRSVSLSPSVGTGKRRMRNVGGESDGEIFEVNDDQVSVTAHRRRELGKVWGREKDECEIVDRLLTDYKKNGLVLPPNFARIRPGRNTFHFGTKAINIKPGGNNSALTVKVGGGHLQLDEFVGKHYRAEMEKLRKNKEVYDEEHRPPGAIVLPEVPYRKTHGSLARKLMYGTTSSGLKGKPSMRNMSASGRQRLGSTSPNNNANISADGANFWGDEDGDSPSPPRPRTIAFDDDPYSSIPQVSVQDY